MCKVIKHFLTKLPIFFVCVLIAISVYKINNYYNKHKVPLTDTTGTAELNAYFTKQFDTYIIMNRI